MEKNRRNNMLHFVAQKAGMSARMLVLLMVLALLVSVCIPIGAFASDNVVSGTDVAASDSDVVVTGTDTYPEKSEYGEPRVIMTTSAEIGTPLMLGLGAGEVYIDCGDGNIVRFNYDESYTWMGSTAKIYFEGGISHLSVEYNQLTRLDVSNCPEMTQLYCMDNNLTELDVSNNIELVTLACERNKLNSLDVSNNKRISILAVNENNLSEIDVSQLPRLDVFTCQNNNLTALDLSANSNLLILECQNNNLTKLDVSNVEFYELLDCSGNNISELKVNAAAGLTRFECQNNRLCFSSVPYFPQAESYYYTYEIVDENGNYVEGGSISADQYDEYANKPNCTVWKGGGYRYAPQADITVASVREIGQAVDLSSEHTVNGVATVYTWRDASTGKVVEPDNSNGIFTFDGSFGGKTVYCDMTNSSLPGLTIKTSSVKIAVPELAVEDNTENKIVDAEISDDFTSVDADNKFVLPSNLILVVNEISGDAKELILKELKEVKKVDVDGLEGALVCDIDLVDNNHAKVNIVDGGIEITLNIAPYFKGSLKGYAFKLYHLTDGKVEEIKATVDGNNKKITFCSDDFSPYILTWEAISVSGDDNGSDNGNVKTDDEGSQIYTILAVNLLLLSAGAVYLELTRWRVFFKK